MSKEIGPWFIWKELAMQHEGMTPEEIAFELPEHSYFDVMSGTPRGVVTRGRITGCQTVVTLDADDFADDDSDNSGRELALKYARLIAAAPALLKLANSYALDFKDERQARAEFGDAAVDRELQRRAIVARATGQ